MKFSASGLAFLLVLAASLAVGTALFPEPAVDRVAAVGVDPTVTTSEGPTTTVAPNSTTATTTAAPGTTNPDQVANRNALVEIPDIVLDTIGGRDLVKVVAFDRNGSSFDNWSGNAIQVADGRAEIGKGQYVAPEEVSAPIAIVGRISYSDAAAFEIVIETGEWNTDEFLRWGVYADAETIYPDVGIGKSEVEFEVSPIPPVVDDDFWLVVAVDHSTAMLSVVRPGSDTAEAISWTHDWTIENWNLGIAVFSGVLSVDKYYILAP